MDNQKQDASLSIRTGAAVECLAEVSAAVARADQGDEHLATDHLLANLKGRTISSGFVTGMAQSALFVLNFGSTMVLARLLAPQEFGLVAMVTAIMGFLRIFNEAGLATATVQREGITHAQ